MNKSVVAAGVVLIGAAVGIGATSYASAGGASRIAPDGSALNDAEIAHIAVTANRIDIDAARAALPRVRNATVREFAQTMIRDHEGVIEQAVALATRLGVTPADNDVSRQLLAGAKEAADKLSSVGSSRFDRAYIDHEVTYHAAVVTAVAETLIPNTQNAELKGLLEAVLPALRAHLAHAERLAAELR